MQVTKVNDHITHAVVGGQGQHTFGINDSPEFFRILSSNLYSDKRLAVVREIMCNAWDAHIEFGCTDVPIEVTLTKDSLVIKDFGPGISHANILKNYTTYGGTTKIANDNVTGGFGLGSKAPFAYVDHFEVVSCFEGKKSIYRMSLSSAEMNGKPSVMKIMDAPTEEHGITVTLDIQEEDYYTFREIICRIASNGEMNVRFNGDQLKTLPFSQAPNGFVIMPREMLGNSSSQVMVRYGHVIYPVETDPSFKNERDRAVLFLASINNVGRYSHSGTAWSVVLYAKPGEVSITPSRESLSMTDDTNATIKRLLTEFVNKIQGGTENFDDDCFVILKEAIEAAWADGIPGKLCSLEKTIPNKQFFDQKRGTLPKILFDRKACAWHYMCSGNYPDRKRFQLEDFKIRVQAMIDQNFGNRQLNKQYLAELKRLGRLDARSNWAAKRILWPLIKDIKEQETAGQHSLKVKNLFSIRWGTRWGTKGRAYTAMNVLDPIMMTRLPTIGSALPYLRRVVILSHNRMDISSDEFSHERLENFYGETAGNFAYIVPRQAAKIAEAIAFFTKRGFEVIDLTPDQLIERDETASKVRAAPKPKRKGVPTLRTFINPETGKFDPYHGYYEEGNELIEKPEFVTMMSPQRINVEMFQGMPAEAMMPIIRLYGDKGACVPSRQMYDKLIELGAKPLEEWVKTRLVQDITGNKLIEQYYRNYRPGDYPFNDDIENNLETVLKIIRSDETLRRKWKLPKHLPQRETDLVTIWESMDRYERHRNTILKPLNDLRTDQWLASDAFKAVKNALSKNRLIRCLHLHMLISLIRDSNPQTSEPARRLLVLAMKG